MSKKKEYVLLAGHGYRDSKGLFQSYEAGDKISLTEAEAASEMFKNKIKRNIDVEQKAKEADAIVSDAKKEAAAIIEEARAKAAKETQEAQDILEKAKQKAAG